MVKQRVSVCVCVCFCFVCVLLVVCFFCFGGPGGGFGAPGGGFGGFQVSKSNGKPLLRLLRRKPPEPPPGAPKPLPGQQQPKTHYKI